jgi:hypothetical protein
MRELLAGQDNAYKAFKGLISFKDNWITYLESIDFEAAD